MRCCSRRAGAQELGPLIDLQDRPFGVGSFIDPLVGPPDVGPYIDPLG